LDEILTYWQQFVLYFSYHPFKFVKENQVRNSDAAHENLEVAVISIGVVYRNYFSQRRVIRLKSTYVSEEQITSIFRIEE
jgi:hypothetical protein